MKNNNVIGIDVSEASIKALQLDIEGTTVAYESVKLTSGIVKNGNIVDESSFVNALDELFSKMGLIDVDDDGVKYGVALCLPESKIFSHFCVLPDNIKDSDSEAFVLQKAEKIIPFKLDNLYWNFHTSEEDGIKRATFISVRKDDLDVFVKAFATAKVELAFVGGELFALGQSLLQEPPLKSDCMILDIGAYTTTIGLFSIDAVPNASIVIKEGGEHFTRHLVEKLGLTYGEAESQKRHYGLDTSNQETEVPQMLREYMGPFVDKIREARNFFENITRHPIEQIVIAGGSALLPKMDSFISERMETNVSIADPMKKLKGYELPDKEVPSVLQSVVIGLALVKDYEVFSNLNFLKKIKRVDFSEMSKDIISASGAHSLSGLFHKIKHKLRPADLRVYCMYLTKKFPGVNFKLISTMVLLLMAIGFLIFTVSKYF
ncbi:pilus assembly protein PilM [Candidatus Kaiserbacteria bacterium]|nr:pilus assembly protein PilM [Candidatus Kaiserbacteria bacterium]